MSTKIIFQLVQDSDGYPPVAYEGIWADHQGREQFRIDNIPFFTRDATLGDVVEAKLDGGEYVFFKNLVPSDNSLFRIIYYEPATVEAIRNALQQLGCSTELNEVHHLISVNIPSNVPIEAVQSFLQQGFESGQWDYEEAIIRQ